MISANPTNETPLSCLSIVVAYFQLLHLVIAYFLRRINCLVSCFQIGVCICLSLLFLDVFSYLALKCARMEMLSCLVNDFRFGSSLVSGCE